MFIAQSATVFFSLVTSYFLANYLTESDYGNYRYVLGLAMTFGVFSLTGIGQSINQAVSKNHEWFYRFAIKQTLVFGLFITSLSLAASIYYFFNNNLLLVIGALLIAIFHPVSQLFGCTISFLHGNREFKASTFVQFIKSMFVSASVLLSFYFSKNVIVLLIAYFISQALAALVTFYVFQNKISNSTEAQSSLISKKYFDYAKHTSVRNILDGFTSRLDTLLVFQQLGAVQLATYSVASLLPEQIRGSFKNLQTLLVPKYVAHHDLQLMQSAILKRSVQLFFVFLAITFGVYFSVPIFYEILFPKYAEAAIYAQLLSLSFPASIYLIPLTALQTQHREKDLYLYNIITSTIQLASLGIGLITLGLLGVVLAKVITQYFRALILFSLLHFTKR